MLNTAGTRPQLHLPNRYVARARPPVPRRLLFLVVLSVLAGTAAVFVLPFLNGRSVDEGDFLIGVLTTTTVFPVLHAAWSPTGDIFSPAPLLSGMFFVAYACRAMYLRDGPVGRLPGPPNLWTDFQSYITPTLELVTACWLSMLIGCFSPLAGRLARLLPGTPMLKADVNLSRASLITAFGLAATAYLVLTNRANAFAGNIETDVATANLVAIVSSFVLTGLFVSTAVYCKSRGTRSVNGTFALTMAVALLIIEVAYGVYQGGKSVMFFPMVIVAAAMHYFRRRLGISELLVLLGVLIFLIIPFVRAYRVLYLHETRSVATLSQSAQIAQQAATKASEGKNLLSDALTQGMDRLSEFDCPMVALKMTPRFLPWSDPTLYALFPIMAVVPRVLWSNKPHMVLISNWEHDYWGYTGGGSSIARSMIGALYCAFGFWGTVLGMGLNALGFQTIYLYLRRFWGVNSAAIYATFLMPILQTGMDLPTIWAHVIQDLLVMFPLCWFMASNSSLRRFRRRS